MAKNLANIWSYSGTGDEPRLLGRVRFVDGAVRFEQMSAKLKATLERGIAAPDFNARGIVRPSDGRAFMDALPEEFNGSAVRAELVEE